MNLERKNKLLEIKHFLSAFFKLYVVKFLHKHWRQKGDFRFKSNTDEDMLKYIRDNLCDYYH